MSTRRVLGALVCWIALVLPFPAWAMPVYEPAPTAGPRPITLSTEAQLSDATRTRARRLARIHRGLQIATSASLAITGLFLGTIAAINQPTAFGDGHCTTGGPVFGSYGCSGLSVLHGVSAVISVSLYVGTETLDYVRPRLEPERPTARRRAQHVLRWIHRGAIAATPLLGLMGARPEWIGVPNEDRPSFQKTVRTIHIFTAALLAGAYIATTLLEQ